MQGFMKETKNLFVLQHLLYFNNNKCKYIFTMWQYTLQQVVTVICVDNTDIR